MDKVSAVVFVIFMSIMLVMIMSMVSLQAFVDCGFIGLIVILLLCCITLGIIVDELLVKFNLFQKD